MHGEVLLTFAQYKQIPNIVTTVCYHHCRPLSYRLSVTDLWPRNNVVKWGKKKQQKNNISTKSRAVLANSVGSKYGSNQSEGTRSVWYWVTSCIIVSLCRSFYSIGFHMCFRLSYWCLYTPSPNRAFPFFDRPAAVSQENAPCTFYLIRRYNDESHIQLTRKKCGERETGPGSMIFMNVGHICRVTAWLAHVFYAEMIT